MSDGGTLFEFPKLYTELAKYYDRLEMQYRDYTKESDWISGMIESKGAKEVIDLSCGTGTHLWFLREKDPKSRLIGMDASKEMVALARKKLGNVPLVIADFLNAPLRGKSFDIALCLYWSIAGLNEALVSKLFSQAAASLREGGLLIFDTENAEGIKENLLNEPFIDAFFQIPEENLSITRTNYSRKSKPDLVDWRSYYSIEKGGVTELRTDRMDLRFYSRGNLEVLLDNAGFSRVAVFSGPGEPYVKNSPSLYFVAEKKG